MAGRFSRGRPAPPALTHPRTHSPTGRNNRGRYASDPRDHAVATRESPNPDDEAGTLSPKPEARSQRPEARSTKHARTGWLFIAPFGVVFLIFLGVLIVYFLVPLRFLIVASTKDAHGLFAGSAGALWFDKTFDFFGTLSGLFTDNGGIYLRWMGNSALYALATFAFRGRNLSFAILVGSVMVPLTALVIPTFVLTSQLGLTDTIRTVILPSLLNPFGVYSMRVSAADAVPDDLLDAARMDGAGEFGTFFQGALPPMRPAVVTVLLLSVVGT